MKRRQRKKITCGGGGGGVAVEIKIGVQVEGQVTKQIEKFKLTSCIHNSHPSVNCWNFLGSEAFSIFRYK